MSYNSYRKYQIALRAFRELLDDESESSHEILESKTSYEESHPEPKRESFDSDSAYYVAYSVWETQLERRLEDDEYSAYVKFLTLVQGYAATHD